MQFFGAAAAAARTAEADADAETVGVPVARTAEEMSPLGGRRVRRRDDEPAPVTAAGAAIAAGVAAALAPSVTDQRIADSVLDKISYLDAETLDSTTARNDAVGQVMKELNLPDDQKTRVRNIVNDVSNARQEILKEWARWGQ